MRDTLCQALPSKLLCRCGHWRKAFPSMTGAIKEYEEIVRKMRTVHSEYVTVCFPSRPLESTPNTSFSNEGSQSQNPYRS